MKGPTRSPAIRRLLDKARAIGYRVEFCEMVPCGRYPMSIVNGVRAQGLCDREAKVIRVATRNNDRQKIAAILSHELEHAQGADHATDYPEHDLHCGGMRRAS